MCRLVIMIGNLKKDKYILKFLNQSINKKNTPILNSKLDVDYHKDGFGLSWKNLQNDWNIYKKPYCFNEDKNINEIINKIDTKLFIGHIRAVCPNNTKICFKNTHPFIDKNQIWCHNGSISNFNEFKNDYENINKKMVGETDSEFLFHLFKSLLDEENKNELDNLINRIIRFFSYLNKKDYKISANIIYSSNNYAFISRYINKKYNAPSLYTNIIENNIVVSSEPIVSDYKLFPNNFLEIYDLKKNKKVVNLKLDKL